jgi:hypothetical protein
MRSATIFGKTVNNWQLVNDNLKPHLAEMPQVQPIAAELETVIGRARTLENEQEITRGRLRELIRQRQDTEKQGENLRRRLASFLRGTFGFTSEQLIQFGINPRPKKTRPRKAAQTPEEPQVKTTAE